MSLSFKDSPAIVIIFHESYSSLHVYLFLQHAGLFLVLVCVPIYCMYTYFLTEYFDILSFPIFLSPAVLLHPPTKIPVLNDQPFLFFKPHA